MTNACPACALLFTTWITTCPECERVLERAVEEDGALSFAVIASRALHGPPPAPTRGWWTGGVVRVRP